MNKKVIIFDLDGVLFDTTPIAEKSLMRSFHGFTPEIGRELLVGNFHEELAKLTLERVERTEEEKEEQKIQYAKDKAEAPMFEGMKELLAELHEKKYIIILNTSAYERNCIPLLEKAGIKELFDFLGTAEVSKSKVEKFVTMEKEYGVSKDEMLFITDTLGDIREASEAQIPTIAVTWGAHDRSYFTREHHATLVGIVDTVEELRESIGVR